MSRWAYTPRGYALAQSIGQFGKRKFSSLSTLLVFGITMALPALIFFTASSLAALGSKTVSEESLTVYLKTGISDLDGAALAQSLQQQPAIRDTQYISRDEALAVFQQQANIEDALNVLGENPLPGAIVVYPQRQALSENAVSQLASNLDLLPESDRVQYDLEWVKRLQALLNLGRSIGWLLTGFLTLTALLVIGNTVRLELLRRRDELEVAHLLGAKRSFLQRPMIYSGALFGFLGGVLACIISLLCLNWIRASSGQLTQLYASSFTLEMPTLPNIGVVLATATALGLLGALSTLYRPSTQLLPKRRPGV